MDAAQMRPLPKLLMGFSAARRSSAAVCQDLWRYQSFNTLTKSCDVEKAVSNHPCRI